ncbi:MAG: 3-hydroxyacyl-CoA dehydrogenase family protein [Actinobacteria bacterium]|nr:3-hydroxyacyl-CoA dehydrogenase family protein [Actinomycetota bacterium]
MNPEDVGKAAVIGAGTMGHSIALVFAMAGVEVKLVDVDERVLSGAWEKMGRALETLEAAGRAAGEGAEGVLGRVTVSTDAEAAAAEADLVIEAVPEVPEIKKEVFARLDGACRPETVIASNTSGLDIFGFVEISRPERLLIAHWFNPPHVIPLVEVVPGPATSPEVLAFTASLMERLGKKPVVMKGFTRAFIVNKIQNMISLAVFELLGSGLASPEEIDRAVKYSLGIRLPVIGVVQSLDFTGLDLVADLLKSYGLSNPLVEEKVAEGCLGVKTSRGLYDYGGRSEAEVCRKRDELFLRVLACLEDMGAFEPV